MCTTPRHFNRESFLLAALVVTLSCSSSTEPAPPVQVSHPAGSSITKFNLNGFAHGISIAADGTMLITRFDSGDVATGRVGDFSFGPFIHVGAEPNDVALTPDGRTAFVPMLDSPHVAILDTRSYTMTGTISVAQSPLRALVTPDGNRLYITSTGQGSDSVSALYDFDAHTHALIDTVLVGAGANGITYNPHTGMLYVSTQWGASVYEIRESNDSLLRRIPIGGTVQDVAVTPDGEELWVATEGDVGVQVVDLASGVVTQSIAGTKGAYGLAVTPDGAQFYVARDLQNMCDVIDRATHTIVTPLDLGLAPQRVAFNAAGTRAVFTDGESGAVLIQ